MINALVFVLAFVALGLGVVGVAMRSGRRRKGGSDRAKQRATITAVLALAVALGVVVPALVMGANSKGSAENARGGIELTAAQAEGRQHFKINCANCHALAASNAVGRVGPDLDELRPNAGLTLDAIKNGRARGQGQMPSGILDGKEARDVAEYVAAVAGR